MDPKGTVKVVVVLWKEDKAKIAREGGFDCMPLTNYLDYLRLKN